MTEYVRQQPYKPLVLFCITNHAVQIGTKVQGVDSAFGVKFLPASGAGVVGKKQIFFCWKEKMDGHQPSFQA